MALPVAPVDGNTYTFGGVDHIYTAATDSYAAVGGAAAGSTLPADAVGALNNDGAGTLTWEADTLTWTTATRPAAPTTGQTGLNTTLGYLEYWDGAAWVEIGGGSDDALGSFFLGA